MNWCKKLITAGLTASMLTTQVGIQNIAAQAASGSESGEEDRSYNVLFITVDQEHYFSEYPEGTNLKARQLLAELGTTFEKHYACSNMSTSSRSVMFTGTHIPDTGMIDNTDFQWQGAMDDTLTTVGDMMREAGYYTALKGKWHLGDASILHEGAQLTDLESYGYADWGGTDYIGSVREGNEMDPVIVSETLDWLENKGKQLNEEGQPFFLNVNMVNPHDIMNYDITDYQSPFMKLAGRPEDPLYDTKYDVPIPESWNFDFTAPDVPDALRIFQAHWGLFAGVIKDADVWKDYQDYYFNCIQDSDNNLMEILDYLAENGFLENTVIVFTADHGEMQGSHGLKGKGGFLYENNIHVPLIIVHPDYEGGKTVSAVTSHVDLAPTFVDAANISPEKKAEITAGLPGTSLLTLMDGSQKSVRDASLFCFEMLSMTALQFGRDAEGNTTYSFDVNARGMVRGIITDQYKFVRYFSPVNFNTPETLEELFANNDVQLFDLNADPEEMVNLAADPEANAELIMQLNELLNQTISREIGQDDGLHVMKVLKALQERNQAK
ncbi:MAG: sulfatase-like hydrolase/transferase [Flexilinea sp.]|nr:sulfatase-like hydrolase/transferase [Flexilinea sp.]